MLIPGENAAFPENAVSDQISHLEKAWDTCGNCNVWNVNGNPGSYLKTILTHTIIMARTTPYNV